MRRFRSPPLVLLGVALLALAALWRLRVARRWTDRVPPGWSNIVRYTGYHGSADPVTGRLPAQGVLGRHEHIQRVVSEAGRPDSVRVEDRYTIRDLRTGTVTYEHIATYTVDPRTGAHLNPRYRGQVLHFPRRTRRRTYLLRSNYATGVPLAFEDEADVAGLSTYVFHYLGPIEYTEAFAGTPDYPGVRVGTGEAIRCADDQFHVRVWVEPLTGMVVRRDEGCPSGDYVYDVATGRPLRAVDRWSGSSAGTDLLRRVAEVRRARRVHLAADAGVPAALAGLGLAALAAGVRRARRTPRTQPLAA